MKKKTIIKYVFTSIFFLFSFLSRSDGELFDKEMEKQNGNKFEYGVGFIFLRINHYRGSDEFKNYYIPTPYVSYVSDKIEAETSFIRGILYKNELFSIKVSLSLGFSVESKDNKAREGMPDIGYIFEVGPMIEFNVWKSENKKHKITFDLPIRQVFETNFTNINKVGLFGVPHVNYVIYPQKLSLNWQLELSAALMYGDKKYHDFFYAVDKNYETPSRPEYHSNKGYSGYHFTIIGNKKFGNILLIPFLRYDNLKNTVFEDSPLVKSKHFFLYGIGAFYLF